VQHVQTRQDCGACHGTITWAAATFSHLGLTATCQSCHNGVIATAKQPQHVNTTLDCGSCHNTLTWTVVSNRPRLRPLIPSPRGAISGPTK
jgi:ribosomal protein S27AE